MIPPNGQFYGGFPVHVQQGQGGNRLAMIPILNVNGALPLTTQSFLQSPINGYILAPGSDAPDGPSNAVPSQQTANAHSSMFYLITPIAMVNQNPITNHTAPSVDITPSQEPNVSQLESPGNASSNGKRKNKVRRLWKYVAKRLQVIKKKWSPVFETEFPRFDNLFEDKIQPQ